MGKPRNNDSPLGWDDPLPESLNRQWQCWRDTLPLLENIHEPRCYHPKTFGPIKRTEIHAFADASKDAIGTATYLRQINIKGQVSITFLFGRAKVAPIQSASIPRLELCGAVLATQAVQTLCEELDLKFDEEIFYTDSKVVLGYI